MMRAVVTALLLVGCGAANQPAWKWPDATVQLRDDGDRDAAIDRLWVMPPGAERDRARGAIAAAIATRIADAIADEQPFLAARLFDQLIWMWHVDPQTIGAGLAAHRPLVQQLRGVFAKSGHLAPAVLALVVLAELVPAQRAVHLAEVDEILQFADDLGIAENGPEATRAEPTNLLAPAATTLPLAWLVDRYVGLLLERQRVIGALVDKDAANIGLVREYPEILTTVRRVAIALARAGRPAEIHRRIENLHGIGTDRELAIRAEMIAEAPSADAYVDLAEALRSHEHLPDAAAALAVARSGLARYPGDPGLLVSAGTDARTLGRVDQAIAFYERALGGKRETEARAVTIDTAAALRLGKLYGERISRLATNGRPRAATAAWEAMLDFTGRAAKQQPHMVWQQTEAIAETALGRGLASQGMVRDGRGALKQSLERAPSIDAYETLATLDVQTARYRDAQGWADSGIALLGEATLGDRYRRAKIERVAGDALRRGGKAREASGRYLDAMRAWASLGVDTDLPRNIVGERRLDLARCFAGLGDAARAVDEAMLAIERDPESAATVAAVVAFLIESGNYREALDAFHGGVGQQAIGELYKVYMSLWIIAEGRRLGLPRDPIAVEYLGNRRGDLWYELLAKAATGRLAFEALRAAATTGPRQGELAFYGAMLGLDPEATTLAGKQKLLQKAIDSAVVFDAEYDLARRYLAGP